ncbi:MAG: hypothetical protein EOO38_11755 [Cytophagaceae bacterium]|nr:MAG: hypothetical protein EOO38_11755 [Cytophagaceae bacterium]
MADPVEEAAREVAIRCRSVGAESIDQCARLMGRSPEFTAARRALIRMYEARSRFVSDCSDTMEITYCQDNANWLIGAGIASAVLPRSD